LEENAGSDKDLVEGFEEAGTGEQHVPETVTPVSPSVREKHLKYTKDLPISDIRGISDDGAGRVKAWLADHNFVVIRQLATAKIEDIAIKGLGSDKIKQIIDMARREIGYYFMTPVSEIPGNYETLKSGVDGIDDVLGGGFRTGDSYEFFGPYGCGKTQISIQAACRLQLPIDKGGMYDPADPDGRPQCLWLDTEKTMKGMAEKDKSTGLSRIDDVSRWQYIKAFPKPEDESEETYEQKVLAYIMDVNKNILIVSIESSEQQMYVIEDIMKRIDTYNIRLIVVDSIITHFRSEFIGRGTLSDRQQKLNKHIHDLLKLAGNDGILIVTNQVQANPDGMSYVPAAFNFNATGGHVVQHNFNVRLKLRKGKAGSILMELVDASYLPNKETNFVINHKGVESME
jgi:DNA repair protein RadA